MTTAFEAYIREHFSTEQASLALRIWEKAREALPTLPIPTAAISMDDSHAGLSWTRGDAVVAVEVFEQNAAPPEWFFQLPAHEHLAMFETSVDEPVDELVLTYLRAWLAPKQAV